MINLVRRAKETAAVSQRRSREELRIPPLAREARALQQRTAVRRISGLTLCLALSDDELAASSLPTVRPDLIDQFEGSPKVHRGLFVRQHARRVLPGCRP